MASTLPRPTWPLGAVTSSLEKAHKIIPLGKRVSYRRLAKAVCDSSRSVVMASSSSAAQTEKDQSRKTSCALQLTYLEGNTWLWDVAGVRILVDPLLVGNLDFGIPWLYSAAKKKMKDYKLEALGEVDCLIICQGLDDHCHARTLEPLCKMYPDLRVIATPNAEPWVSKFFKKVTYIEPGESTSFVAENGVSFNVTASAGPVLGPPWQRPENGYYVEVLDRNMTIYIEPHCVYDKNLVEKKTADVLITPVIKQTLPLYTLVSGQEDAVELAKALQPRYIVPMDNGDLDDGGIISKLITKVGSRESFKEELAKVLPDARVLDPQPGVPFLVQ